MARDLQFEEPSDRSIWLWPDEPADDGGFRPWLDPYLVDTDRPVGAVVIFPGGGYACRVAHESGVVARMFNEGGMHAFVAHYRVKPHTHPGPLADACRAIRMIRHRADEWGVQADKIAVCGFSAGGHLTAHVACAPLPADPNAADPLERLSARPNAQIPCYPVVSSTNRDCYLNLVGDGADDSQIDAVTPEKLVSPDAPPAFLWHTADDAVVPVGGTFRYAQALLAAGVSIEMHVYPHGLHGLGLSPDDPHVATWTDLARQWLGGLGWVG